MLYKAVKITRHCVLRMLKRYREWQAFTDEAIVAQLTELALTTGTPVGGQINDNVAIEILLPTTNEKIYLAGHIASHTFVVRTVLSREQLISNIRAMGLRSPSASPTHEQRRHKRHKKLQRYLEDHQVPTDERPYRTKRDQKRVRMRKKRYDDETLR